MSGEASDASGFPGRTSDVRQLARTGLPAVREQGSDRPRKRVGIVVAGRAHRLTVAAPDKAGVDDAVGERALETFSDISAKYLARSAKRR